MVAVDLSVMLLHFYQTSWQHIPEDTNLQVTAVTTSKSNAIRCLLPLTQ